MALATGRSSVGLIKHFLQVFSTPEYEDDRLFLILCQRFESVYDSPAPRLVGVAPNVLSLVEMQNSDLLRLQLIMDLFPEHG